MVLVQQDNTAEIRPVELGTISDGMQVIKSGVKAGDTVVVDGLLKVRPGQKVDPKPISKAEAPAETEPAAAK